MLRKVSRSALVPFTAEAMFALVNDVASYPDFLPWCSKVELHEQSDALVEATLHMRKGKIRKAFRTRNTLQRPDSIDLALVGGPFRRLDGGWRFEQMGETGCKVSLDLQFEFENRVTDALVGAYFEHICNSLIDAFTQRATEHFT